MSDPILTSLSALAAEHGYSDPRSLRRRLDRVGVLAVGRAPGRNGESLYNAGQVADAVDPDRAGTRRSRTRELSLARDELTRTQAVMILETLHGTIVDASWNASAPTVLAGEIADGYDDDEDGPDADRRNLADKVSGWPRVRALAVIDAAALALDFIKNGASADDALAKAGLQP